MKITILLLVLPDISLHKNTRKMQQVDQPRKYAFIDIYFT